MRGPKSPINIVLKDQDRKELEALLNGGKIKKSYQKRIKSILMLDDGNSISNIKRSISLERRIIRKWAYRYLKYGLEGLDDTPRSGRPTIFDKEVKEKLLKIADCHPKDFGIDKRRWTCKSLSDEMIKQSIVDSISPETVRRVLKKHCKIL